MSNKRQKTESVISRLLGPQKEQVRTSIRESQPYKHGVIHNVIDDETLRKARDEIFQNIHFTEKETDIYKVNQTGDLANLGGLEQKEKELLKNLGKVRDALYSQEFRDFMSYTTDCGPLSGSKQDLSINLYNKGCHLLNHDDVIGTRRVSYILYLTPPDDPWQPKWGGALRLFPTVKPGIPETDWTVSIPPEWNQLAYFKVQPGHSFHDVEEVYVDKDRLSISGWFHVPQEGEKGYDPKVMEEDADKATLAQLESITSDPSFEPRRNFEKIDGALDEEAAKSVLRKFLNSEVLDRLDSLAETFAEDSMIQIEEFLNQEFYEKLAEAIEIDDLAKVPKDSTQVQAPWKVAKPPHIHRFMYLDGGDAAATESLAAHKPLEEIRSFFSSPEFAWFLEKLTSLKPVAVQSIARRFRPGHDFTLATTSESTEPVLEATLCVTPSVWNDQIGGYDLIMAPDSADSADPAVYRSSEDNSVLLTSLPAKNEFTLVYRESGLLRFIKYVSKSAPGSRWDVTATYEIEDEDDDENNDN